MVAEKMPGVSAHEVMELDLKAQGVELPEGTFDVPKQAEAELTSLRILCCL